MKMICETESMGDCLRLTQHASASCGEVELWSYTKIPSNNHY